MRRSLAALSLLPLASGHGLLLHPPPRSAGSGILSEGGSYWYTQSSSIGCSEPNVSWVVNRSTYDGDLCPEDHSGNKTASIVEPSLRTYMGDGCFVSATNKTRTRCTGSETALDWTRYHPWRAPGRAPMYDPCGMAGASPSNNSQAAGGWGYATGYAQGFKGSQLPPLPGPKIRWVSGGVAEVAWASVANHGGGYQYSLCPVKAGVALTEECFQQNPLSYATSTQTLRYIYPNQTANKTEVEIEATRTSRGTVPEGSTWTKHPVPTGVLNLAWEPKNGRNGAEPQFEPPQGCDEHCWGYGVCDVGFVHPSYEGWNDPNRPTNKWMPFPGKAPPKDYPECANGKDGEGCCHTSAYMAVVDKVQVPKELPLGDYVLRWRWDAEQTPQIWANCADVAIESN